MLQTGLVPTDSNKFGVLRESMRKEKREKIIMAFDHACLNNQSFNETLESILKVWNIIPSSVVNNRMASVTTDNEEKICFRFNQVHKIMSEQQKKDTGYDDERKNSDKKTKLNSKNNLKKSNNSSRTNGLHNPSSVTAIPLATEHYIAIGNSRGRISDTNPNGLSKLQMRTMKSVLIYENNKTNNSSNNNINNNNTNNNMQGDFEPWENRNNINFSQPITNIASFTMASVSVA